MARYNEGDVILVHYAYYDEQGIKQCKPRPAVVLEQSDHDEHLVVQITSKNRSKVNRGIWVLRDSPEGEKMGLLLDSFINIDETVNLKLRDIIRKIGVCPYFDRITSILNGAA